MGIRTLWATKGSWSRGLVLFNLILMRANHSVGAGISFAHYGHKEQIMKNDKLTNETAGAEQVKPEKVGWLCLEINQMGY